jgi:hypothetical protein
VPLHRGLGRCFFQTLAGAAERAFRRLSLQRLGEAFRAATTCPYTGRGMGAPHRTDRIPGGCLRATAQSGNHQPRDNRRTARRQASTEQGSDTGRLFCLFIAAKLGLASSLPVALSALPKSRESRGFFDLRSEVYRQRDRFRSLVSNAARWGQSCSVTAGNFDPSLSVTLG